MEQKTITQKIEEAREFCEPFIGKYAAGVLTGNELLHLQRSIQHYQQTIQLRDSEIDSLREALKDSNKPAIGNYYYLGQPYSSHSPTIQHERAEQAMEATAKLIRKGLHIFSPIVHGHELALVHELPKDFQFWKDYALAMLTGARGMIVLTLPGWEESIGLRAEIEYSSRLPYHEAPIYMSLEEIK